MVVIGGVLSSYVVTRTAASHGPIKHDKIAASWQERHCSLRNLSVGRRAASSDYMDVLSFEGAGWEGGVSFSPLLFISLSFVPFSSFPLVMFCAGLLLFPFPLLLVLVLVLIFSEYLCSGDTDENTSVNNLMEL